MMPTGPRNPSENRLVILSLAIVVGLSVLALVPPAQATNGVVKDMTFLLHSVNATETAKSLPGGSSTLTYFDTTLQFNDVNVSILVQGTQKVLKWALSPALAGDFTVESFTLQIWSNSSTAASSSAQVTLEVREINATTSALIHQVNLGSVSFAVTPELKTWSSAFAAPYAFRAGSSIEIRMIVTPGALQGIWAHYDTAQFNSRVSFRGPDSLDVAGIVTLDADRNATANFDPLAADTTMYVQAQVTDPIGGYDIRWVNATIISASGTILVNNASMTKVSGTALSFESTYEFTWNYGGQPTGPYTVLVWALDNSGHNHYVFFQQFTYANYPDVGTAVFYIGGLPSYVWIQVVDSRGLPLEQAFVTLSSGGSPIDSGETDSRGMVNLTAFGGTYDLYVTWADVLVAQTSLPVTGNVSESDPFLVGAGVFYPAIRTVDDAGTTLSNAAVYLVYPNGTVAASPSAHVPDD